MSGWPYSERVARYFVQPANLGPLAGNPENMFTGLAGDRAVGTQIEFQALIPAGTIDEIAFRAFGCPHSIAACSLATERLTGQPAEALMKLAPDDLARALDVPVEKTGRLLLVQDALHQCFIAWDNSRLGGK